MLRKYLWICLGVALFIVTSNGAVITTFTNENTAEYSDDVETADRTKRSGRGYMRGQTQSQYLNFGKPEQDGKAEAEATETGSRSTVSGTHGMGQAQSQFSMGDCSECGPTSIYEYPPGTADHLTLLGGGGTGGVQPPIGAPSAYLTLPGNTGGIGGTSPGHPGFFGQGTTGLPSRIQQPAGPGATGGVIGTGAGAGSGSGTGLSGPGGVGQPGVIQGQPGGLYIPGQTSHTQIPGALRPGGTSQNLVGGQPGSVPQQHGIIDKTGAGYVPGTGSLIPPSVTGQTEGTQTAGSRGQFPSIGSQPSGIYRPGVSDQTGLIYGPGGQQTGPQVFDLTRQPAGRQPSGAFTPGSIGPGHVQVSGQPIGPQVQVSPGQAGGAYPPGGYFPSGTYVPSIGGQPSFPPLPSESQVPDLSGQPGGAYTPDVSGQQGGVFRGGQPGYNIPGAAGQVGGTYVPGVSIGTSQPTGPAGVYGPGVNGIGGQGGQGRQGGQSDGTYPPGGAPGASGQGTTYYPGSGQPTMTYVPGGLGQPTGTFGPGVSGRPSESYTTSGKPSGYAPGQQTYLPGGYQPQGGETAQGYIPSGSGPGTQMGFQVPAGSVVGTLPGTQGYYPGGSQTTARGAGGMAPRGQSYYPGGSQATTGGSGGVVSGLQPASGAEGGSQGYYPGMSQVTTGGAGSSTAGGQGPYPGVPQVTRGGVGGAGTGEGIYPGGSQVTTGFPGGAVPGRQILYPSGQQVGGQGLYPGGGEITTGIPGSGAPGRQGVYPGGPQLTTGGAGGAVSGGQTLYPGGAGASVPGRQTFYPGQEGGAVPGRQTQYPGGQQVTAGGAGESGGQGLYPAGSQIITGVPDNRGQGAYPGGSQYVPGGSITGGRTIYPGAAAPGGQVLYPGVAEGMGPGGQSLYPGGTITTGLPSGLAPGGQFSHPGAVTGGGVPGQQAIYPGGRSVGSLPGTQSLYPGGGALPGPQPLYPGGGVTIPGTQVFYPGGAGGTPPGSQMTYPGGGSGGITSGTQGLYAGGTQTATGGPGGLAPGAGLGQGAQGGFVPGGSQGTTVPGQQIMLPGASQSLTTGGPSNIIAAGGGAAGADDAFSQAESTINDGQASASAQGKKNGGTAKTQVSGTYSSSGTFSASAMTSDNDRSANAQVSGSSEGAMSQSQGQGGAAQSQAQVQVNSKTGDTKATSQSGGVIHQSQSEVQANDKGGLADAQSSGPGQTSSQAQIGFRPRQDGGSDITPSSGGGQSSSQSGAHSGQSQSQIHGKSKFGISYHGAAQSASGTKEQVATYREQNRELFHSISQFGGSDAVTDRVDTIYNGPALTSESESIPDLHLKASKTSKEAAKAADMNEDDFTTFEDEDEGIPEDEYDDDEDFYSENSIKLGKPTSASQTVSTSTSSSISKADPQATYHVYTQRTPTQSQQAAVANPTDKYTVVQNQNGRVQRYPVRTTTEVVPSGFRGTVNVEKKFHTKALQSHKADNDSTTTSDGNRGGDHPKLRAPDSYVTVTKSITGSMDNTKNPPQENKNFQSTYYTKSSTCGYFTFSCNIVYGANGRSKICRPKAPTNGKC